MMLTFQILSPLNYLRIKGMHSKSLYDWVFPIILTSLSCAYLYFIAKWNLVFIITESGFIEKLLSFTAVLPGFFIAALAAIATFPRTEIDFPLDNPRIQPTIKVHYVDKNGSNQKSNIQISRRVFLCTLFSFVTFESVLLLIINLFSSITTVNENNFFILTSIYIVVVLFMFWQMLTAAFLGLYYLSFRIHLLR